MSRVTRIPPPADEPSSGGLAEMEALAWLLDNSIRVPLTGGRRFGIDALIGFVPVVGDMLSAGIGLYVVWRGSRLGVPRIVVARMLANSAVDFVIGAIPVVGDVFDLWFKANSRNLRLARRYLEQPHASTRRQWVVVAALIGIVLVIIGVLAWFIWAVVSTIAGIFA